ncbi:hypothetical protein [Desulfovibrio sp. UCD-KL4C]|uniref:hypothetical protein n=1 Tax=Desulfovibrio sp. UCD-KL4C TaxID=2578120 RepID=UPI0025C04688|nr:hypothetical protein [Desulfovibrio sp. UCD-KL4C]
MSIFYISNYSPIKRNLLLVGAFLFLCALYIIPYQEIRIERIRAFGENEAVGTVLEKIYHKPHANNHLDEQQIEQLIRYKFIDPLGQPHERTASVSEMEWKKLSSGDNIIVYYAKAAPRISRIKNEKESTVVKILSKISRASH